MSTAEQQLSDGVKMLSVKPERSDSLDKHSVVDNMPGNIPEEGQSGSKMLKQKELVIRIPTRHFKKKHGCSLDIGGSVIKIVYTACDDKYVYIHCKSYSRDRLQVALQFLKSKVGSFLKADTCIDTCGVGCHQYKENIKDTLGVGTTNHSELDCFVSGFIFLNEILPLEALVFDESPVVKDYVMSFFAPVQQAEKTIGAKYNSKMKAWKVNEEAGETTAVTAVSPDQEVNGDATEGGELAEASDQTAQNGTENGYEGTEETFFEEQPEGSKPKFAFDYPCLLLLCGSCGSPLKVEKDGNFQSLDIMPIGGKFFLGVGGLLTGAKTFEELISLAESGDSTAVDTLGFHVKTSTSDDFYNIIPDRMLMYSFGETVGKDTGSLDKSDLAASVLSNVANYLAQTYQLWSVLLDINKAVFVGGFTSHPFIRDEIGKYFKLRSAINSLGKPTEHFFLKHGAYLGCIGALLLSLNEDEKH